MSNATITKINYVNNNFEILNEFGIEVDLNKILVTEFEQELPCDITNSF